MSLFSIQMMLQALFELLNNLSFHMQLASFHYYILAQNIVNEMICQLSVNNLCKLSAALPIIER